jgi:hypothetical protein
MHRSMNRYDGREGDEVAALVRGCCTAADFDDDGDGDDEVTMPPARWGQQLPGGGRGGPRRRKGDAYHGPTRGAKGGGIHRR